MPLNFGNVFRAGAVCPGPGWSGGPTSSAAARWAISSSGPMGRVWGGAGMRAEFDGLQELSTGRERALERPRAEQQDQPVRGRPRGLSRT